MVFRMFSLLDNHPTSRMLLFCKIHSYECDYPRDSLKVESCNRRGTSESYEMELNYEFTFVQKKNQNPYIVFKNFLKTYLFFVTDLFHFTNCPPGLSALKHVSEFASFFFFKGIKQN